MTLKTTALLNESEFTQKELNTLDEDSKILCYGLYGSNLTRLIYDDTTISKSVYVSKQVFMFDEWVTTINRLFEVSSKKQLDKELAYIISTTFFEQEWTHHLPRYSQKDDNTLYIFTSEQEVFEYDLINNVVHPTTDDFEMNKRVYERRTLLFKVISEYICEM